MTVVAVVTEAEEASPLVHWSARFARAKQCKLVVLHASRGTQAKEAQDLPREGGDDQHPVRKAIREALASVERLLHEGHQAEVRRQAASSARLLAVDTTPSEDAPNEEATDEEATDAPEGGEGGEDAAAPTEEEAEAARAAEEAAWGERYRLRAVQASDTLTAVLAEIRELRATLLVVGKHAHTADGASDLSEDLMDRAPCDTLLLRAKTPSGQRCEHVLIPAAGGPHALVALALGAGFAQEHAMVTPLYVEPDVGDDAKEVGTRQLLKCLRLAGVQSGGLISPRVVLADSPSKGIAKVAAEGHDLLLVGASNKGYVRRVLFGTVPNKLMNGPNASAVAVVRRARPLVERTWEAVETWASNKLPTLDRADRLDLFERLQEGSRVRTDFIALIALSTAIASLGLLQNSPAVVIGAMLVAPLMTPMVGAGLALVQGNVVLVRDAARSIAWGFTLAFFIGGAFGALTEALQPGVRLTHELLARGQPNVLDLLVALFSGMAAAYAMARPNLMGALAGVAIAAALVPPISTVGISFAHGEFLNGEGAALLFATNLVAIILGSGLTFRLLGVHASREQTKRRLWVRRAVLGLTLALVVLLFPLVTVVFRSVGDAERGVAIPTHLRQVLADEVRAFSGPTRMMLVGLQRPEPGVLEVWVASDGPPPPALLESLDAIAERELGRELGVEVLAFRYEWTLRADEAR